MSDQLEDLKRQRALVAEHLAWLDRLIAAKITRSESANLPDLAPPQRVGATAAETPPTLSPPPAQAEDPEALFARFAAEEGPALHPPSKFGCWLVFSLLLLSIVGGAAALIYRAYG